VVFKTEVKEGSRGQYAVIHLNSTDGIIKWMLPPIGASVMRNSKAMEFRQDSVYKLCKQLGVEDCSDFFFSKNHNETLTLTKVTYLYSGDSYYRL